MTNAVVLPVELAPSLRARVLKLLNAVTVVPEVPRIDAALRQAPTFNRCAVCHRSGVLGGHHGSAGQIEWVHRSCHRRLHRRRHAHVRQRVAVRTT